MRIMRFLCRFEVGCLFSCVGLNVFLFYFECAAVVAGLVVQLRVWEDQHIYVFVQNMLSYYNDRTLLIDLVGLC